MSEEVQPRSSKPGKVAFDRLVEVYKARMTISLALLVGFLTVIGFAVEAGNADLFLVAAFVPLVAAFIDDSLSRSLVDPLLYRILIEEELAADKEGIGHLMLIFRGIREADLASLLQEPPSARRQGFRLMRVKHERVRHVSFFLIGTVGCVLLWILFQSGFLVF